MRCPQCESAVEAVDKFFVCPEHGVVIPFASDAVLNLSAASCTLPRLISELPTRRWPCHCVSINRRPTQFLSSGLLVMQWKSCYASWCSLV